jgi:hypothetical protein
VIFVEASFRQIVQVAAATPARIAKRTARFNAARRGPARSRAAGIGRSRRRRRP